MLLLGIKKLKRNIERFISLVVNSVLILDELEMYLDPSFGETNSQTDRVKQSIVLTQQNQIQQNLDSLEKVRSIKTSYFFLIVDRLL